ncbi:MAG: hypothetical protein LBC89_03490, partial [Bacteroidales bacterium]|nr:hypothetical protein [Bacteroidales bacterium]
MLILGFGREGKSVYKYFRKQNTDNHITIADINPNIIEDECLIGDKNIDFILGNDYLDKIFNTQSFENELIIKSPGIALKNYLENSLPHKIASSTKTDLPFHFQFKITSSTDIFLQKYAQQIIGITGTKGKSTTTSLIYHITKKQTDNVLLVGNIGKPALDYVEQINAETIIVFELSSHQLEFLQKAPHISILLNIFEEHLDHYNSYHDYQKAKWNIAAKQGKDDFFIVNEDDELLRAWL